jgi:hypothetical protein
VQRLRARGVVTGAVEPADFPPAGNALPRRQGKALRRAFGLAESAFDALIDERVAPRQRFQVLDVRVPIVVEYHPRVEQAPRIEKALDRAHPGVGFRATFQLDAGRDVASGAVLGLE